MKLTKQIIGIVLALLLILSGIGHFMNPEMYLALTPDFLPKSIVNVLVGGMEIVLGIGVFIPSMRRLALLGIFLLMIVFLPIHILDALKETPVIGSKTIALVRIPIQFVLIYLPWFARKEIK